jgi:hypothetical protein
LLNTDLTILGWLSALPKFTDFVEKPSLRDLKVYRSGDRPCLKNPAKSLAVPQHLLSLTLRQPQIDKSLKKLIITYLIKSQGLLGENINFSICFNISILRC